MLEKSRCNRAFIIGMDGVIGRCVKEADTPNIDALISDGVKTYDAKTVFPSKSFQAWGAMFHGVGPLKHGVRQLQSLRGRCSLAIFHEVNASRTD